MPASMSSRAPAGLLWAASGIVAYVPCIYHKEKGATKGLAFPSNPRRDRRVDHRNCALRCLATRARVRSQWFGVVVLPGQLTSDVFLSNLALSGHL
jgi:hypothetical protein